MVDGYETQANSGGLYSDDPRTSMYHKLLQEGASCASGDLPIDWASGCPATDTMNQSIIQSDTSCFNSLAGSSEGDWDAGDEVSCDGSLHSATDAGIPSDGDCGKHAAIQQLRIVMLCCSWSGLFQFLEGLTAVEGSASQTACMPNIANKRKRTIVRYTAAERNRIHDVLTATRSSGSVVSFAADQLASELGRSRAGAISLHNAHRYRNSKHQCAKTVQRRFGLLRRIAKAEEE
jgi:hypothetical protein